MVKMLCGSQRGAGEDENLLGSDYFGEWKTTGKAITDVVNIGIGGLTSARNGD